MDLKRNLPLYIFLLGLGFGGYKLIHSTKNFVNHSSAQVGENRPVAPHFLYYLNQVHVKASALIPESVFKGSECAAYVAQFENLALDWTPGSGSKLSYYRVPEQSSGCVIIDEAVNVSEKAFLNACVFSNPVKSDLLSEACTLSLLDVRASLTHFLYKQKKPGQIESAPELVDLIYYEFIRGRLLGEEVLHPVDYRLLGTYADQLLDLLPSFASAFRLKALQAQMQALNTRGKSESEQKAAWEQASIALSALSNADPQYFSIPDQAAAIATRGFDQDRLLQYSAQLIDKEPSSARAFFWKSLALWMRDEHEEAFAALKKAIELDPSNRAYTQVLTRLGEAGANDEAYLSVLSHRLTQADFER